MRRLLLVAMLAWAGGAPAQPKSDWEREHEEREWKENEVLPPAPPKGGELIEFYVSAVARFRFFIDAPSLSVDADGVVRYTLVARSPSGAETVSYEGIRCKSGTYKVYAYANGGAWSPADTDWRAIVPNSVLRWHPTLRREYFCPFHEPIRSAAEGLDALRRGGHPKIPKLGF